MYFPKWWCKTSVIIKRQWGLQYRSKTIGAGGSHDTPFPPGTTRYWFGVGAGANAWLDQALSPPENLFAFCWQAAMFEPRRCVTVKCQYVNKARPIRKPTEQCRTSSEGDLHTISCCQHEDFVCGGCICTWLQCKSSGSSKSLSGCPGRVVIQTSPSSAGRFPRPLGQWQKNSRYVCQQGQPGPKRWSRDGKSF